VSGPAKEELAPLLDYLRAIGWEEVYAPRSIPVPQATAAAAAAAGARAPAPVIPLAAVAAGPALPRVDRPAIAPAAERGGLLATLRGEAMACSGCTLAAGRRTVVFGSGSEDADLMFIGEGPGAEEDRQGLPFVGPAGQLLSRIIQAMGRTRDEVYICNVVKCRPPGNRDPQPEEVAACRHFLEGQVRLVAPKVIVALGRIAAQTLLGTDAPVGRMRGSWHQFLGVPLRVTYHPAAILRNAALKRPTWDDMLVVRDRLAGG
jgi:uracil-DNA glycosylase